MFVKKIQDISISGLNEEVNISCAEQNEIICGKNDGSLLNDLKKWWNKKSLNISPEKKDILVETKKWKSFDALENKYAFPFLRKKISLKKKTFFWEKRFFLPSIVSHFKKEVWNNIKYINKNTSRWGIFFGILCFSLLLAFSLKLIIEWRVNAWYTKLLSIKQWEISLDDISKNINNARLDFFIADILFTPFSFLPWEKINSIDNVISGGRYLSKSLDKWLWLYHTVHKFTEEKRLEQIYFSELFLNTYNDIKNIRSDISEAKKDYREITWLPSNELLQKKNDLVDYLDALDLYVWRYLSSFTDFLELLGHDGRKKYLIVFQNADEIRPTWGFMGSMGLIDIFKGQIKLFEKKDVYAIEWDLKSADYSRLPAPKWLSELTTNFWLRDANYFANTKDSAEAIKFFTDQAWININGVIFINQNIILDFLELTWPIFFEDIWQEISSENFSELISLLVEAKVSKKWTLWTPKQVLFDFMKEFIHILKNDAQYFEYFKVLARHSKWRDIMLWSFDKKWSHFLNQFQLTWELDYYGSLDAMYPVYTSLSWNKSDRYMTHSYNHTVTKNKENCDYEITQKIKLSHNMWRKSRNRIQDLMKKYDLNTPNLFKIQWADRNRQYVRVILPEDAQVSPQKDMEIVDYGRRKGVEFFLTTPEQQASYFEFTYSLPNPECKPYSFKLYKQPGIRKFDVQLNLDWEKYEYFGRDRDFYFEERE